MRLTTKFRIVVFAVSLAVLFFTLATPRHADAAASQAHAFALKNMPPIAMMYSLGLLTMDDFLAGKTTFAYDAAKKPSVTVPGIKLAVPYDADKVLIVYGEPESIDELAAQIVASDVTPQKIQVKAEAFRLTPEKAKELGLGIEKGRTYFLKPEVVEVLRLNLSDSALLSLSSPIVHTLSGVPAKVEMGTDRTKTTFCVLPRLNRDKSITLSMDYKWVEIEKDPEFPGGIPASRQQSLKSNRRFADGETVIVGGGFLLGGDSEIVLVTASVVQ